MRSSGVKVSLAGDFPATFFLLLLLLLSAAEQSSGQPGGPDPRLNPYSEYGRISPAMAIMVVVLIASLFFVVFFSIYIRHCARSGDSSLRSTATSARRVADAAARGLDAAVIETFPTFVYSEVKALKIGKHALECAICLNEFQDDETLRLLPKCDHVFHPHCIGAWLEGHVTCPVCRTDLAEPVTKPVEPDTTQPQESEPVPEPEVPEPVCPRVKLPRSHTTGHSLIPPGENTDRFTLRLPDDARKRIMANWKMNRSNSLVVLPRRGGSRKQVDRVRSERWLLGKSSSSMRQNPREMPSVTLGATGDSVRSDRWAFLMNPSFLWRNSSVHLATKDCEGGSVQSTGSVRLPV